MPDGVWLTLVLFAAVLSGCGSLPNANRLTASRILYRISPRFVGAQGPLTYQQGQRILAELKRQQHVRTDMLGRHLAFEQAISGSPLILGNKVTLLENGPATFKAMLDAINNAKHNINFETYIFSDDSIGQRFADALIAALGRGVIVNVIYDSAGSFFTADAFFERLRSAGMRVVAFNPLSPISRQILLLKRGWSPEHRDHRKLLVVDGKVAFTGGINISNVYCKGICAGPLTPGKVLDYWRDTDVAIRGPAVASLQHLFFGSWRSQTPAPLPASDYFPPLFREGDDIARVIGSVPEQSSVLYVTLMSAINNAETNIYITDAYFAPNHKMIKALERAARRGVDVRLLLPGRSDHPTVSAASRSHYASLMNAGVKIYQWRGDMLHEKTATIDRVWSTVGTSNLDWWSLARDNELNVVVLSYAFASEMNVMYANDLENSVRIDPEKWRDRPWHERIHEDAARLIQPLL
ncbi:MAG: phospholipase D-like domain-containing protein [Candidatus Binataceae bacterium]